MRQVGERRRLLLKLLCLVHFGVGLEHQLFLFFQFGFHEREAEEDYDGRWTVLVRFNFTGTGFTHGYPNRTNKRKINTYLLSGAIIDPNSLLIHC